MFVNYDCPNCGEATPHAVIVPFNETVTQIKCTRCAEKPFFVQNEPSKLPLYSSIRVSEPAKSEREDIAYLHCNACAMKQIGTKIVFEEHPTHNVCTFKCKTCSSTRTNVIIAKPSS